MTKVALAMFLSVLTSKEAMAAGNADHTGESLLKNCYMGKMSENNNNRGVCTGYINAVIDMAMATGQICEINFDPKSKASNSPNSPNYNADWYTAMLDDAVKYLAAADKQTLTGPAALIILNKLKKDFPCYHGKQRGGYNE